MNANYQYFMIDGYNYVSGKGGGKGGDIIGGGGSGGGGGKDVILEEMDDVKPIYSKPIVTDTVDDVSPIESKPISSIGDAALETKDPSTTINIYNPEGGTSTTSTESDITVDANTGKVTTPASKGGARGGGGGIGGGKGKGKGKPSAAPKSAKKAIVPLAAIGIGVAILIFKPFKFLK